METKFELLCGDTVEEMKKLPDGFIDVCITSPPYYALRDYGNEGQIGLEKTPEEYIQKLVLVFREVKRILKDEGTCWINIGDSYWGSGSRGWDFTGKMNPDVTKCQGSDKKYNLQNVPKLIGNIGVYKNKDLIGIPWMLAFALRADGWYLRQDIIWAKPNPMPESVKDRCTRSHEYIFMLTKQPHYYFNNDAIQEDANPKYQARYNSPFFKGKVEETPYPNGGANTAGIKEYTGKRNKRDVWHVPCESSVKESHFAVYPKSLILPCILASCPRGGA